MNNVKLVVWKTKDGIEIPVRDMGDSHLVNAIRFCERRADQLAYLADRRQTGDISETFANEPEWFLAPQYSAMCEVAKSRGIQL